MAQIKQLLTAVTNVRFGLNPSSSHQTHIVLQEDVYNFVGGKDGTINLNLLKSDFIDAATKIMYSLPLYKRPTKESNLYKDGLGFLQDAIVSIEDFFSNNSTAILQAKLSTEAQGRRCLQNLLKGKFNLMNFLVENHSELVFDDSDNQLSLRLNTSSVIDFSLLQEKLPKDHYNHIIFDVLDDNFICNSKSDLEHILNECRDEIYQYFNKSADSATFTYLKFFKLFEKLDINTKTEIENLLIKCQLYPQSGSGSGVSQILNIKNKLKVNSICGVRLYETDDKAPLALSADNRPLQIIYYGAPGTGKSHKIKDVLFNVSKDNIFRTTFHPDSDYSTFVGAYKPTMKQKYRYENNIRVNYPNDDDFSDGKKNQPIIEKTIEYEFIPQAFMQAYIRAYNKPTENVYLVIEEINRGNCAQIFGDLFQLLDRDESGKSEYNIKADADLCNFLKKKLGPGNDGIKGDELCLPPNLYIWATMNTSDQSLFPIDSAFKRRWDWEYRPINYSNTTWTIKIGELSYSWTDFQKKINEKIYSIDNSEDKQLGDYFVNPRDGIISAGTLLNKILFYLWNDVCKDDPDEIFKVKTPQDEKNIKFSEFFGEDKDMKLQGLMAYIDVKPITDNQDEAPLAESEEPNSNE